jgi:pyrroline-5-carboxylate reductase
VIRNRKIGFIGAGNMAQAMIKALVDSKSVAAGNIYATNRSPGKLKKVEDLFGVRPMSTNEELVEICEIVVVAVKPQDLAQVLEPIASSFHPGHLVISIAAGFSTKSLQKLIPGAGGVARAMPNTPATIRKAVVGYCLGENSGAYQGTVEDFLKPLGLVVPADEGDQFVALTVSCGSGTGFVFEVMQYWQEWVEEHGFDPETARKMVVQTFLGAAELAAASEAVSIQDLQDRVVSKKGVTFAGLQSMRELEVERALRYSFEKAALRDQEITRGTAKQ